MDMQGSRKLAVGRQQAWEALNDPEVLKVCVPGCESIEATGEHEYALVSTVKVGPVAAKFKSTIQLADIQAPESYTLNFNGNGGAAGFGKGSAKVALTPQGEGCELAYTVNATVGGKIAQVGQRLIDGVAKAMAESFFKRFDEEMQRRYPAAAKAPAAGAADSAVSTGSSGARGSGPAGRRVSNWIWVVVAVLVILGIAWATQ
ncbi:carbon monoxide dehydrogenase subunit G [Candidimonas humi]|jgi:carbon monoxide dehydrogenase subunit G|uniref:CoxG family protein n=1 Tax=Candidimonas humi TaxID=683355 RepID=A0ABV8NV42_9BURK|nr:carbon monoxide dehydrogenase subunit G [Candidimonas humi]MBV6305857.1 carbon monoxide dehydrogenase subunit G [Candidimonas humi]